MMTREKLKQYVSERYTDMSVVQMSRDTGENVSRIYSVCYEIGVRARARKHRTDKGLCSGRPTACYSCPYPDCVCNESMSEGETAYLFMGREKDENKKSKKLNAIAE